MPSTTPGTTIGSTTATRNAFESGTSYRTSATLAGTPTAVASTDARVAMVALLATLPNSAPS